MKILTNVICKDPQETCLQQGKEYSVTNMEIKPFETKISLKEFPNLTFNSSLFTTVPV